VLALCLAILLPRHSAFPHFSFFASAAAVGARQRESERKAKFLFFIHSDESRRIIYTRARQTCSRADLPASQRVCVLAKGLYSGERARRQTFWIIA
jgi:hypothetical protein